MNLLDMLQDPQSVVTTLPTNVQTSQTPQASVVTTPTETEPASVVTTPTETEPASVVTTPKASVVTTPKASVVTTPVTTLTPSSESMPEQVRQLAEQRLRFLMKVREVKMQNPKLTDPLAVIQTAAQWSHLFPLLTTSGQHGKSQLTYQNYRNWTRRIKENPQLSPVTALGTTYKRGYTDPQKEKAPEFYTLFNRIWLHANKQSVAESYRNTCDTLRRTNPAARIPTVSAVHYYVAHLRKDAVIHEREGEVAWRNTCCDYIDRDWSPIPAGHMIIGDSRPFDTRVRIWRADHWEAVRPTLSALMDARSWKFISWIITADPVNTDDQIRLLAQYCCITGGIVPAEAYFDNGKDYSAQGYTAPMHLAGHDYSIFASLGIQLTHARPYNGRAKTIEPNFKNVMQRFDKKFPDYLGSNPTQRPDAASYFDKNPDQLPDLDTFVRIFNLWLTSYHQTPKNGIIQNGKSPDQVWADRTFTGRRFTGDELREAFMRPYDIRTIGRGGRISVNSVYYITDDAPFGTEVIVKTDVFNSDTIGVYDLTGRRIGSAYTRETVAALARGDEYEMQKLSDRIARQKAQEKAVKLLALDLKGGTQNASPIEEMLTAGTDIPLKNRGEIHTVKGKNHVFKRLAPAQDFLTTADPVAADETPATRYVAKNDTKCRMTQKELDDAAEIAAAIQNQKAKQPEDQEDLSDIYNYIHNKTRGDQNEEF